MTRNAGSLTNSINTQVSASGQLVMTLQEEAGRICDTCLTGKQVQLWGLNADRVSGEVRHLF